MNKKILHIINGEFYAGAERVQDLLAINLTSFGYEVGFICLKKGMFKTCRKSKTTPLHTTSMSSHIDLRVIWDIVRILKRDDYQLIHTHTPRTALVGLFVSLFTGCPTVHHIHGTTLLDTEIFWRNRRNVVIEYLSTIKTKAFIPVSSYARDSAIAIGLQNKKMRMVWNGVPTPELANQFDLKTPFVIGSVALFRPKKGIEILIEAFAKLKSSQDRPAWLNLIGEFETFEYEKFIKDKAQRLGIYDRINWVGFSAEIYSELKKISVFVLPSLYGEGLPMAILEAMAAGVPVVATNVGGIEELICNGESGLLIKPGNCEAMCAALESLSNGSVSGSRLGSNARQRQTDYFSDHTMAQGVASVYNEILEN